MASNSFGQIFRITTFGESHGKGIGVVIDGCPSGYAISLSQIEQELERRRPGASPHTSPRSEPDKVEILSGIFEGKSTGAPIALFIQNKDHDSKHYDGIQHILRPGHANYTYLQKYGIFDYRGGGRASARETVARVAAGSIAKQIIAPISIRAWVDDVGGEREEKAIYALLEEIKKEGDSIGGIIACEISNMIAGLGDPVYEKLEAKLASAMLSIPASKGIEFAAGFSSSQMRGSECNDPYTIDKQGKIAFESNHHGGILAGISSGENIHFRVAFKPTSSIKKPQRSVTLDHQVTTFQLPEGSRHDPCVALRAPPIVEAMASLVLVDSLLQNRACSKSREEAPLPIITHLQNRACSKSFK